MRLPALAVALALSGCVAHVRLPAPLPSSAPLADRQARAAALTPLPITVPQESPLLGAEPAWAGFLMLNDGTRVRRVEDLAPTVGPDSLTAARIRAVQARAPGLAALTAAQLAVSLLLTGCSLTALALGQQADPTARQFGGGALIATTALLVPLWGTILWGRAVAAEQAVDVRAAFRSYEGDMRSALGLPAPR